MGAGFGKVSKECSLHLCVFGWLVGLDWWVMIDDDDGLLYFFRFVYNKKNNYG